MNRNIFSFVERILLDSDTWDVGFSNIVAWTITTQKYALGSVIVVTNGYVLVTLRGAYYDFCFPLKIICEGPIYLLVFAF